MVKEYRSKGVAQKLLKTLIKAALKHKFEILFLGTVDKLQAAHKFYNKYGFERINRNDLPNKFEICPLDTMFFKTNVNELNNKFTCF